MSDETNPLSPSVIAFLNTLSTPEKTMAVAEGLAKVESLLNGIRIIAEQPDVMTEEGQTRILAAISAFRTESDAVAELEAVRLIEKLFS